MRSAGSIFPVSALRLLVHEGDTGGGTPPLLGMFAARREKFLCMRRGSR